MDELEIHSELLKVNNIHHSLDANNIMSYVILMETNKSKFNQAQLNWIQERIDLLEEKNRKQVEDSLKHVDLELCKMPLSSKTCDGGYIREA